MVPGDRVTLSDSLRPLWVETVQGLPSLQPGDSFQWPDLGRDLSPSTGILADNTDHYVKLFFAAGDQPSAAIENAHSRERLWIVWDQKEIPYFGFWLTRGGWAGHHHWALEPTHFPGDCPVPLAGSGVRPPSLPPGQSLQWNLRIEIQSALPTL
jgi:hypothetical protein